VRRFVAIAIGGAIVGLVIDAVEAVVREAREAAR
jgi:hypothetical protein